MASVWKRRPNEKHWLAAFRDGQGRARCWSTGQTDRDKALLVAREFEHTTRREQTKARLWARFERLYAELEKGRTSP